MPEEKKREPGAEPTVSQPRGYGGFREMVDQILAAIEGERERLLYEERPVLPPDLEAAYGSREYPKFIDELCYPWHPKYTKQEARTKGIYHTVVDRYLIARVVRSRSIATPLRVVWDLVAIPAFCFHIWRNYRVLSLAFALRIDGCYPEAFCIEVLKPGMEGPALFCLGRDKAIIAVAKHLRPTFVVTTTDIFDSQFKTLDDAVVFCDAGNLKRIKVYSCLY